MGQLFVRKTAYTFSGHEFNYSDSLSICWVNILIHTMRHVFSKRSRESGLLDLNVESGLFAFFSYAVVGANQYLFDFRNAQLLWNRGKIMHSTHPTRNILQSQGFLAL